MYYLSVCVVWKIQDVCILSHCPEHMPLWWRHNDRDGVLNHQSHETVYSRRRSKKTSKFRDTGLFEGNSPVIGEFPAQRASDAENVFVMHEHNEHTRVFRIDNLPPFVIFHPQNLYVGVIKLLKEKINTTECDLKTFDVQCAHFQFDWSVIKIKNLVVCTGIMPLFSDEIFHLCVVYIVKSYLEWF